MPIEPRPPASTPPETPTSPWRWLLVIVPLVVIAAASASLFAVRTGPVQLTVPAELQPEAGADIPTPLATEPRLDAEANTWADAVPETVPPPAAFNAAAVAASVAQADADQGAKTFRMCSACHTGAKADGHKIGPNLWGVVGRSKGSAPGFSYSRALAGAGGAWSYEELAYFLHNPRGAAPGTSMAFAGISDAARLANLLAYLRTLSDAPEPPAQ